MGNSTFTLQRIVNEVASYPEVHPVLGKSPSIYPAVSIANDVMSKILAQGLNFRFNRANIPPILSVALQQDYLTTVTDVGWFEQAWRIDINNSTNNGNRAPKPVFTMETVRDLAMTASQSAPFNMSWIPNRLALYGQWSANTAYGCGYGVAQIPVTPIQQFIDKNGNFLYIDSTVLGLNPNSPGFTGTTIALPTPNPYGISGSVQPIAPPNAAAGLQVTDGTVTWTVAPQNGYAVRVAPLPAFSGLAWLMCPVYQKKPPVFTSLQQTLDPLPDDVVYLFRQGFIAACYVHTGSPQAPAAYQKWEEDLMIYLRSGDRERDDSCFYPSEGLTSGGSSYAGGLPVGPGFPFTVSW